MKADKNMEWERDMVCISYGILALACLYGKYQVDLMYLLKNKFVSTARVFVRLNRLRRI